MRGIDPSKPITRLLYGVSLLCGNETYTERKRELLEQMVQSRNSIKSFTELFSIVPESSDTIMIIIAEEQAQLQATFNELVALNKQVEKGALDGLSVPKK